MLEERDLFSVHMDTQRVRKVPPLLPKSYPQLSVKLTSIS